MMICALAQALDEAQCKDLLFWASRYHLFVTWSPDRSHPWDSLPTAGQYSTLEIGQLRGSDDKARILAHRVCNRCATLCGL